MAAILGLDLGQKRVGVAVCEEGLTIATGLMSLEFKSRQDLLEKIKRLLQDYQAVTVIVGLPLTLKGVEGIAAQKIQEQVEWFRSQIPVSWILWDERLSTAEVERVLLEADLSRARRKEVRDQLAAQRILQNYIDYQESQKK